MKMRITGTSIRLRLTEEDSRKVAATGSVEESLLFPGGRRLTYALRASTDVERLAARFDGDSVTVFVPSSWIRNWADVDTVGFEGTQTIDGGDDLHLVVEKDAPCMHKRADESLHPLSI